MHVALQIHYKYDAEIKHGIHIATLVRAKGEQNQYDMLLLRR